MPRLHTGHMINLEESIIMPNGIRLQVRRAACDETVPVSKHKKK